MGQKIIESYQCDTWIGTVTVCLQTADPAGSAFTCLRYPSTVSVPSPGWRRAGSSARSWFPPSRRPCVEPRGLSGRWLTGCREGYESCGRRCRPAGCGYEPWSVPAPIAGRAGPDPRSRRVRCRCSTVVKSSSKLTRDSRSKLTHLFPAACCRRTSAGGCVMAARGRRELRYRFLRHLTDRFARQRASLSRTEAWVLSSFLMPAGWPKASPLRAQASPTRISTPRCTR